MNRVFTIQILIVIISVAATVFWLGKAPDKVVEQKPQTPIPPYSYSVEDILVTASDPTVALGGTLTVPFGEGPFPAVILLSVAGPNDRDQSFAGSRNRLADRIRIAAKFFFTRCSDDNIRMDWRSVWGGRGVVAVSHAVFRLAAITRRRHARRPSLPGRLCRLGF